nr:SDR family NAD(P)-dependent oxidoreductase [Ramlibacter sp.]
QVGRSAMEDRLALAVGSIAELTGKLERFSARQPGIEGLHRGSAASGRETAALFADDDDLGAAVRAWAAKGKHDKLLELWVKGVPIDWKMLWTDRQPRRVSLPTYPFARDRYWVPLAAGTPAPVPAAPARFVPGTLLIAPAWHPATVGDAAAPSYGRHCIVLCAPAPAVASYTETIEAALPSASVVVLDIRAPNPAQRYTEAAGRLLELAKELIDSKPAGGVLLQLVVPAEGELALLAGLNGLLRIARLESRPLTTQLIEFEACDSAADVAGRLAENLRAGPAEIRYRKARREVAGWREVGADTEPSVPWKAQGIYLITGGAGGLGLLFAREIAQQAQAATLVLTGRSKPTAATHEHLRRLEAMGARAEYQCVDVGDAKAVAALVEDIIHRFGELNGILHAAGVIQDNYIQKKSAAELAAVFSPKVQGVVNLDLASRELKLDCFILFSSIAAVFGNLGQADYAAANAFLDGYAIYRNELAAAGKRHGQTISVNWPLWEEGGMRADAATLARLRDMFGLVPLSRGSGLRALYRALAQGCPRVAVLEGDVTRLRERLRPDPPAARALPADDSLGHVERQLKQLVCGLLKVDIEQVDAEAELAVYGFDSISASQFVSALNETYQLQLKAAIVFEHPTLRGLSIYLTHQHAASFERSSMPPAPMAAAATGDAEGALAQIAANVLKLDAATIDPQAELSLYGFDSISASQFVSALNETYRLQLTAAVIFEHPTLRELAAHLARAHPTIFERPAPAPGAPASSPRLSRGTATCEPVAIIGLAGRFPQAADIDEFWRNLQAGKDCIAEVPPERGSLEHFYTPDVEHAVAASKSYSKWGGFLEDVEAFDHRFFNMSAGEAQSNGPKVALFLETVWALLERAGYTRETLRKLSHSKVGVYVGAMPGSYTRFGSQADAAAAPPRLATIANRVSHFFNCTGPSVAVDTMSSSAMMAIHMACESIRHGTCAMAIAGGVSLLHPQAYIQASQRRMLATQVDSRSFGTGGGLILSECVGAVLLKPLSAAVRDQDTVLAVVRSSAASHAGGAIRYSLLDPNAQAQLIRETLEQAGVSPRSISYVEAAANGSPLSDLIEVSALAKAFEASTADRQFCAIGSVESNVGHTGPATGLTQLAKVVLQLTNKQLVPCIKSLPLNKDIRFESTPFFLQPTLAPWLRPTVRTSDGEMEYPRRAMINSVGGGGAYVNLIVEEYSAAEVQLLPGRGRDAPQLVVLSAKDPERLQAMTQRLVRFLDAHPDVALEDLAYTLQAGREEMTSRLAVVADSCEDLAGKLARHLNAAHESGTADPCIARGEAVNLSLRVFTQAEGLRTLAAHWVKGGRIAWQRLHRKGLPRRIALPTYPFFRHPHAPSAPEGPHGARA